MSAYHSILDFAAVAISGAGVPLQASILKEMEKMENCKCEYFFEFAAFEK
jgi:hypothetical protein